MYWQHDEHWAVDLLETFRYEGWHLQFTVFDCLELPLAAYYYWIEAAVAHCALHTLQEAQGAVKGVVLALLPQDQHLHEHRVAQIAVVDEV